MWKLEDSKLNQMYLLSCFETLLNSCVTHSWNKRELHVLMLTNQVSFFKSYPLTSSILQVRGQSLAEQMVIFVSSNQIPARKWLPPPPLLPLHGLPLPPDAPLRGGDQKPPSPVSGQVPPITERPLSTEVSPARRSWAPTSPPPLNRGPHLTM